MEHYSKECSSNYPLHTFRSHRITELIMSGVEMPLVARHLGLSPNQISKTYLRFIIAGYWDSLVRKDKKPDSELRVLISQAEA